MIFIMSIITPKTAPVSADTYTAANPKNIPADAITVKIILTGTRPIFRVTANTETASVSITAAGFRAVQKNGCVARALKETADTLAANGIETETIHIGNKDVRGCISCGSCLKTGKCVFNDIVNEVAPKFEEADGIIVGTPVYYAGANGSIISFLDRLFYSTHFNKTMKVGASIISSRRGGSTSAYDEINKYFGICNMPIVTSSYWNEVHGFSREDVEKDAEGLQTMRNLGRNMAFMIKAISLGKKEYGLPQNESGAFTSFADGL